MTRRFGFEWTEDINIHSMTNRKTGVVTEWSEVAFVSDASANGGSYHVIHNEEEGTWDLLELGGRGPNIWDREVEIRLTSPLAAMHLARKDHNQQLAIQLEWENHSFRGRSLKEWIWG